MKRNRLYIVLPLAIGSIALSGFGVLIPTGAPPGMTGSPGDNGQNCTSCHGGTAINVAGWISSNIPASGYIPGNTYQIVATNNLTNNGKYGFEVTAEDAGASKVGVLTAGATSQLVGSGKYVTHTLANSVTNSWTFNWTAPSAGTGPVTFYGAFARSNFGQVRLSQLTVDEGAAPGISGILRYGNAAGTVMSNCTVLLTNSLGDLVSSTTTAQDGSYSFSGVPAGNYVLSATITKPWGGVNAADALAALKHFVNMASLTGLKLKAADVDNSGFINAVDALTISKRYVNIVSSFPVGDWYVAPVNVTMGASAVTQNLSAICYGDTDASYTP